MAAGVSYREVGNGGGARVDDLRAEAEVVRHVRQRHGVDTAWTVHSLGGL